MRLYLLSASVLLTMGCATTATNETPELDAGGFECSAEGIADLIGRPATNELGIDALQRSHSRTLRWIRPGDAVTMDYRPDRLNINLDASGNVERLGCG